MRPYAWIGTALIGLIAGGWPPGGAPPCCEESRPACCLQRLAPAGGWHPYGGGLLRWWDPHWFPRCGSPDDYCRKPLPHIFPPPCPPCSCAGVNSPCTPVTRGPGCLPGKGPPPP
jgi:hypothetical protein